MPPTLDDLRSSAVVSGTPDPTDFVPYFDISEYGNGPVKKTTPENLVSGAGGVLRNTDSVITVADATTDEDRAAALVLAYAAAKLLTPDGAALSATNRATVLLPPGAYKFSSTFVANTDFVDFVASHPERGGPPTSSDDWPIGVDYAPLSMFRPPRTFLYSDESGVTVFSQTARDIRLTGFGIAQLYLDPGYNGAFEPQQPPCNAFQCPLTTAEANDRSIYTDMYFWHATPWSLSDGVLGNGYHPTGFAKHVAGTWRGCTDGAMAMRVGLNGSFTASMYDCFCGPYSIGGDAPGGTMGPCRLERVVARGLLAGADDGSACFGGCNSWGIDALSSAWFVECLAGPGSFSIGASAGGNYIRCRSGGNSFGSGTTEAGHAGIFSGYAEDCVAEALSFGAKIGPNGKITGTLRRCTVSTTNAQDAGWHLESAEIYGCRFVVGVTGVHTFTLLDSASVIYDTEALVLEAGTGVPIYAASARSVKACHCRFNNADNDADGLHANVTNLIATPYNVVDSDIS